MTLCEIRGCVFSALGHIESDQGKGDEAARVAIGEIDERCAIGTKNTALGDGASEESG
jgi:hypothetical protein